MAYNAGMNNLQNGRAFHFSETRKYLANVMEDMGLEPEVKHVQSKTKSAEHSQRKHIVAKGENLYRISLKYEVPVRTIKGVNRISDPTDLKIGQTLIIPYAR